MSNINIYPKYVIFSAYFSSLEELDYEIMKGMRVFSYGVNHDNFRQILNDIIASGTGESYVNTNADSRIELTKCVGDACLCFGEMEASLNLDPEYLKPLACADICWGEEPGEYPLKLKEMDSLTPRSALLAANQYIAGLNPLGKCAECFNYMNSDKYSDFSSQGFTFLVANNFNNAYTNELNMERLREFSEATKFSFVPNIIECRTMDEITSSSDKNMANPSSSHLFFFGTDDNKEGLFLLLNTPLDSITFKIFSLEHEHDSSMTKSVIKTSFLRAEKASSDFLGGFSI
jgi:hypothetical protein